LEVLEKNSNNAALQVESGIRTSSLVSETVELGLTGLESFLGVPGRLGGAVFNNAHFKNEYIGDYIQQVEVLNQLGDIKWLSQDECEFAYDRSRFQTSGEVILRVKFTLKYGDKAVSKKKIKEATLYRIQTQPLGMPSSGCIFQNVPNNDELKKKFPQFENAEYISAGFLIDQAGLKGLKQGGVKVSSKHAAFIVNEGNAAAQDVLTLIEQIKSQVKQEFNVELQEEVFWLD
jgi:UDP-N-acetylmuramate dehydrogenase